MRIAPDRPLGLHPATAADYRELARRALPRQLFDYIDENPIFEFHPSAYTNDPFRIAQNDRMIAINSAIEALSPSTPP